MLTFGEAAEYAGVSLLDLRERLRAASVPAVWGWRAGAAVHLIPLEGLQRTFPELASRTRVAGPSLAERGIELLPADKGADPGILPAGASQPRPNPSSTPSPEGMGPAPVQDHATGPELDRLYGEIEQAAAHNAKLMAELNDAGTGLNKLLEEIHVREQSAQRSTSIELPESDDSSATDKIQQWNQLEAEQRALEKSRRRSQHTSWGLTATFAALLVLVISLKSKWTLMAGQGPDPAPGMPQVDDQRMLPLNELASADASNPVLVEEAAPLTMWDADEQAARMGANEGLTSFEVATGGSTLVDPAEELIPPVSQARLEPSEELVPLQPEAAPEQQESTPDPRSHHPVQPLVLSQEPACLYGKLTAPGQDLRQVLGPCIGPWNEELQSVAGGFRHSGDRFCRHHLIVAKDLGGSVDRARNVATYAREEGLLPPLLRLRVEHGATDLLQKRVGKWVESGFEAGLSGQHTVSAGSQEGRWKIESWVRLQAEPGAQAKLRRFQMELDLALDKGRDAWVSFSWVDGGE
ncbi:MAG: hypothetical protein P1V35_10090 [Planctomycetota bacterium]|nr:hypothetical protein [Planctomycetota bacterium]